MPMNPMLLEGNWQTFREEVLQVYGSLRDGGLFAGKGRSESAEKRGRRMGRGQARMLRAIREFCC